MADFPTAGDDVIFGTSAGETIDALGGNDTIFGGGGDDRLLGNSGDDTLSGGAGLDILNGGRFGSDTASYVFALTDVFADLAKGHGYLRSAGADTDTDTFLSIENLDGGLGNDDLFGNEINNRLRGNGGDDELYGQAGDDNISGGAGKDWLEGRTGNDVVQGGSGADRVSGDDGDDTVKGGTGADLAFGGLGVDHLSGGDGGDWIDGGEDGDRLSGGDGADTFNYFVGDIEADKLNRDLILDFEAGIDKIRFHLAAGGTFNPEYIGSQLFSEPDFNPEVRSFVKNGLTIVRFRDNSEIGAELTIVLKGVHTLSQEDFL